MPVDFEIVHVNSALETEDDISNAITAIRRNGVALKGKLPYFFPCQLQSYKQSVSDQRVVYNKNLMCFNCAHLTFLIGNIETKHTMPPSVKSRNNLLR